MNSARTTTSKCQLAVIVISLTIAVTLLAQGTREAVAQTTHEVRIADFAFIPQSLAISAGDTIIWNSTDPVIHTLWFVFIANGSTYLLSDPIPPDTTWAYTFNEQVDLQYYSLDRLWITGFITVTGEIHDVAVTNVATCKDGCTPFPTVSQNYTMHINVTVENQGDYDETFNVTVYASATAINQTQLSLPSATATVLTVRWNATLAYGNYTLSAVADAVENETDTEDNTCISCTVLVTIPGDVTTPGLYVQYLDLGRVIGTAYGKKPGSPYYDPNTDFNDDHYTQYLDLGILLAHYGQHYP